ncbi:hypothetical protein KAFR_0B03350 [Kazachstania africana CBS 2517]|uniref:Large ribosomal subunit protein mL53 n=1 Tax=Kazachstania africana (strain ATCC 22294 / BCRC 22015 / CBS 2517 / CECT 1963 / NBRC 1671 / NRRL Y-8276) TaxID=1071382 RepID=H2AQI2_KAZAF|nr:hypothetical protein KAFR_0B03350 [Kazachstania africana CBS 2517]CCF56632.1 hypothetical protein KAFR_0B03350 [Kazachstania africana CBS 2517]
MITKYFNKVLVRFNPFGKEAKTSRLFLASIPPSQRLTGTKIQSEILNEGTDKEPLIRVIFKDKKEIEVNPSNLSFQELANAFESHSNKLRLRELIERQ